MYLKESMISMKIPLIDFHESFDSDKQKTSKKKK